LILQGKRVFVAGHKGLAGSALLRRLGCEDCEILTVDRRVVDLTRPDQIEPWLLQMNRMPCFSRQAASAASMPTARSSQTTSRSQRT
jgi:nucleoside-diphosphate-sugar epimerase